MTKDNKTRVLRASEYDHDQSSPVMLTRLMNPADFQPVQIGRNPWPSDEELQELREKSTAEGYEAGRQTAQEEIQKHCQVQSRQLTELLKGLCEPYADLNDTVAKELAVLAINVGSALFRRAIAREPEQVMHIVRSAVAALPSAKRSATIFLSPADLALCSDLLSLDDTDYELKADPAMERGGCRVEAGAAAVDATVNARLRSIAEAMLDQADGETADAAD